MAAACLLKKAILTSQLKKTFNLKPAS